MASAAITTNYFLSTIWPFLLKYLATIDPKTISPKLASFKLEIKLPYASIYNLATVDVGADYIIYRIVFGSEDRGHIMLTPKNYLRIFGGITIQIHSYRFDMLAKITFTGKRPVIGGITLTCPYDIQWKSNSVGLMAMIAEFDGGNKKYLSHLDQTLTEKLLWPKIQYFIFSELETDKLNRVVSPMPFGVLLIGNIQMQDVQFFDPIDSFSDVYVKIEVGSQSFKSPAIQNVSVANLTVNQLFFVSSLHHNIIIEFWAWDWELFKDKKIGQLIIIPENFVNNSLLTGYLENRHEHIVVKAALSQFKEKPTYEMSSALWECLYFKIWLTPQKNKSRDVTLQIRIQISTDVFESNEVLPKFNEMVSLGVDGFARKIGDEISVFLISNFEIVAQKIVPLKEVIGMFEFVIGDWAFDLEATWRGVHRI